MIGRSNYRVEIERQKKIKIKHLSWMEHLWKVAFVVSIVTQQVKWSVTWASLMCAGWNPSCATSDPPPVKAWEDDPSAWALLTHMEDPDEAPVLGDRGLACPQLLWEVGGRWICLCLSLAGTLSPEQRHLKWPATHMCCSTVFSTCFCFREWLTWRVPWSLRQGGGPD